MDWIKDLKDLPLIIAILIIFCFLLLGCFYAVMKLATRGFELAVSTLKDQVDTLSIEVKEAKKEGKDERRELTQKIALLEQSSTGEINQKLDLILQKV